MLRKNWEKVLKVAGTIADSEEEDKCSPAIWPKPFSTETLIER